VVADLLFWLRSVRSEFILAVDASDAVLAGFGRSGDRGALAETITTAFGNWFSEILNYFGHELTNALTEGANSKIRSANQLGQGLSV
jgi:hypothetical protein